MTCAVNIAMLGNVAVVTCAPCAYAETIDPGTRAMARTLGDEHERMAALLETVQ